MDKKDILKYGDWIYKLENGNQKVETLKSVPTSVYKYYSFNNNSKDALQKGYLYCSHPNQLNDSIDSSSLIWDFPKMEEGRYNAFYRDYGIDEINTPNYNEDKKNNFEEIKFHFYNLSTNHMGVISLSETSLNILMWAHYSNEQGLIIEFDWKIIRDSLKELNSDLKNYVFFPGWIQVANATLN